DGRHDRCPAYLRDEHQGPVRRLQHAAVPGTGGPLMHAFRLAALMLALVLAGCASRPPSVQAPDEDMVPAAPVAARGVSGGVFSNDALSLTSDARAYRVGDVVTVILQETTQASKRAGTSFSKESSVGVSPLGALGKTFAKSG